MQEKNLKEITRYGIGDVTPEVEEIIMRHANNEFKKMLKEWLEDGIEDFISSDETFMFNNDVLYIYKYIDSISSIMKDDYPLKNMTKVKFDSIEQMNEYLNAIDYSIPYFGGEKFFTHRGKSYKIYKGKKRIILLVGN